MWVRGLKLVSFSKGKHIISRILCGCVDWNEKEIENINYTKRRILCGCVDWNFYFFGINAAHIVSHPMWVRGLKHRLSRLRQNSRTSHPMWVRGLKHRFKNHIHVLHICVAPHVDAWIQTYVWWSLRQGVIEGPRRQKCEGVLLRHGHVSLSPRVHIFQPVTLQHCEDDICPRASLSVLWRQAPTIIYDQDKVLIHKENLGTLILTKDFTTFVAQEHFTPLFCRKFACYNRF